jgi:hypothetical protein
VEECHLGGSNRLALGKDLPFLQGVVIRELHDLLREIVSSPLILLGWSLIFVTLPMI